MHAEVFAHRGPSPALAAVEADLLTRARAGDRLALEGLLKRHRSSIERVCRRLCSDSSQLDDVLQETYVAIVRSIGSFRGDSTFLTWVYTLARTHRGRALRSAARERNRRERLQAWSAGPSDEPRDLEQQLSTREVGAAFEQALEPLSPIDRAIVVMRDVEGHTAAEIAEATGLTVSAVKTRLHRARVTLRGRLLDLRSALSPA
jgi:RNA polymerase sigma-70 factor (ECF subfamily)